jgi:hypothetical protein
MIARESLDATRGDRSIAPENRRDHPGKWGGASDASGEAVDSRVTWTMMALPPPCWSQPPDLPSLRLLQPKVEEDADREKKRQYLLHGDRLH